MINSKIEQFKKKLNLHEHSFVRVLQIRITKYDKWFLPKINVKSF